MKRILITAVMLTLVVLVAVAFDVASSNPSFAGCGARGC
jgi:hypothetical protein